MAKTGYLVIIYQDINPSSPTYNQTREERTQDEENCPTSAEAHWIEDTKYCELTENGMLTGYEITVYRDVEPLSPTYNQTREERELNLEECEADSSLPNWQNIGEPFCRQTVYMPGGLMGNDGYMVQQQQDMNEYSETADEIRDVETLDLENCPLPNTEPVWQIISESCHLVTYNGQLVYDGTKDVIRVNTNQYSSTWNNNIPETANIEDEINCPPGIERDYSTKYLTFEAIEDGTFKFTGRNNNTLSYSLDGGQTWIPLANGVASPTVTTGNKIMWKGITTPDSAGIGIFSSTGTFNAYGNTMSIVYGDNFQNSTTISDYQFDNLFNNTKVVNAENLVLPATILKERCYLGMFSECSALTTAPELPATTLAQSCYLGMFINCSSLTTAPELPATTLANQCYQYMFYDCISLTTAPELPATTLTEHCYDSMFSYSDIARTPQLPATTLADYCYYAMFQYCTNLVIATELPATTLAEHCYDSMFKDCRGLTKSISSLPATTLAAYCYQQMFQGCTNLNYIICLATDISATNCTKNWVDGVASSGTFYKSASMTSWTTGVNGIPSGWTVETPSA